jgi:acetyl esterase/lipase
MDRRTLLGFGAAGLGAAGLATTLSARGATASAASAEEIALWPGTPPGGAGVHLTLHIVDRNKTPDGRPDRMSSGIQTPAITVYRPAKPDGSALLIMPGGAYVHLSFDKAGGDVARALLPAGVTCFVLRYRLPGEGWADRADVPLQDAQRAMRLIRAGAANFGIDPARVGIIGFSAGGHLAGSLATRGDAKVYAPVDAADSLSAKPDFTGLLYPALSVMHWAEPLLGPGSSEATRAFYSPVQHFTSAMAPVFLAQAADDPAVHFTSSLTAFAKLRAVNVPTEMHIFEEGGHGFGYGAGVVGKPVSAWPRLFLNWGASHDFFRNIAI